MGDYTRLDRGFVNWQGQRVFVPWFGAPRIVPSAEDEAQVLKVRFRRDIVAALTLILPLGIARLLGSLDAVAAVAVLFASGIALLALREHRRVKYWPRLATARSGVARLMLSYFRSLPVPDRVKEFGWAGLGLLLCGWALSSMIAALGQAYWFAAGPMLLGCGLLTFLAGRHAVLALLSLLPFALQRETKGRTSH